jgi:hypothetical protein
MHIASIVVYTDELSLEKWQIIASGQSSFHVVDCLQELLDKLRKAFAVQFSEQLESHQPIHDIDVYNSGW